MTNFVELTCDEMMTTDGGGIIEGTTQIIIGGATAVKGAIDYVGGRDSGTRAKGMCELLAGCAMIVSGSKSMWD